MIAESAFSEVNGAESKHCRKKFVISGNPPDVVECDSDTIGRNGTASEVKMTENGTFYLRYFHLLSIVYDQLRCSRL